jgi:hypothetical protein
MTTLRLTAIRCLCRDRGLVRVKDSVVLKKVLCRIGTVGVVHWSPKPGRESGGSNPSSDARICTDARVVQGNGLQNRKAVSSNLTQYSIVNPVVRTRVS